jgi:hypothetical protein
MREDVAMTIFQRPCSGFTASDLISLQAIWPEGTHESDAEGDRFLVCRPGEQLPWLSIARHRDGTYLSLDLSGRVYARGRSLADLALDGSGGPDQSGANRLIE